MGTRNFGHVNTSEIFVCTIDTTEEFFIQDFIDGVQNSLIEAFEIVYGANEFIKDDFCFGRITKGFYFCGTGFDIDIFPLMQSGYYEGACFDMKIEFQLPCGTSYDLCQVEELTKEDLSGFNINEGMQAIQVKNLIKRIKKESRILIEKLENVYRNHSEGYRVVGGFSDGTAVYEKI